MVDWKPYDKVEYILYWSMPTFVVNVLEMDHVVVLDGDKIVIHDDLRDITWFNN